MQFLLVNGVVSMSVGQVGKLPILLSLLYVKAHYGELDYLKNLQCKRLSQFELVRSKDEYWQMLSCTSAVSLKVSLKWLIFEWCLLVHCAIKKCQNNLLILQVVRLALCFI